MDNTLGVYSTFQCTLSALVWILIPRPHDIFKFLFSVFWSSKYHVMNRMNRFYDPTVRIRYGTWNVSCLQRGGLVDSAHNLEVTAPCLPKFNFEPRPISPRTRENQSRQGTGGDLEGHACPNSKATTQCIALCDYLCPQIYEHIPTMESIIPGLDRCEF